MDGFDEATFEPFRTGIFDNNFEYRVMCGLRNFALHNKLPLGGLILSSKMESGGETIRPNDLARLRIACNPTFPTKALIEDDTMRTATRDEIRDTGAEGLDIKWFVRRFVELVAERQFKIRELTHSGCDNALSEIHSAVSLLELNDDKPLSVFSVQVVSKGSSETEAVVFSLSHLESVNDKRETWETLHHVAGLYISTEIIKKGGVFTSDPPKY